MKTTVVTTFRAQDWRPFACRMVTTVRAMAEPSIDLLVAIEGPCPTGIPAGVTVTDIDTVAPQLAKVLDRDGKRPERNGKLPHGYDYRLDAVRFCRKPLVVHGYRRMRPRDRLIWLDADCLAHQPLDEAWFDRVVPESCDVAYLGRQQLYSECGFLGFNPTPAAFNLLSFWAEFYTGARIYGLREWHDSYAFDAARPLVPQLRGRDIGHGAGARGLHVFINSVLGQRLDHLKGPRKTLGRSPVSDLAQPRPEPYWRASA